MVEARATVAEPVSVVEARDVSFTYDGLPVLEAVDLSIPRGDFVGIVGPNGGGKTTLLRLLLGLLRPTAGDLRVLGMPPVQARERVGYVPQVFSFDPAFPITVLEVVLMGRLGRGRRLGPHARRESRAALEALSRVEMAAVARRRFADLSGGQRQRVLIARALATEPELLLLDEPTANVDVAQERGIYDLLRALNASVTIVMVSHNLSFVSELVRSVLCVNRRAVWHPTCDLDDVDGELLRRLYGSDMRVVRHDACERRDDACQGSGPH